MQVVFYWHFEFASCFFYFGLSIRPKTGSDSTTIRPKDGCHEGNHQGNTSRTRGKDACGKAASVKVFKLMLFKLMQTMFLVDA